MQYLDGAFRLKSLEPFTRHFHGNCMLDSLKIKENTEGSCIEGIHLKKK